MRGRPGGQLLADSGRGRLFCRANGIPIRPLYTGHQHWQRTQHGHSLLTMLSVYAAWAERSLEVDIACLAGTCRAMRASACATGARGKRSRTRKTSGGRIGNSAARAECQVICQLSANSGPSRHRFRLLSQRTHLRQGRPIAGCSFGNPRHVSISGAFVRL